MNAEYLPERPCPFTIRSRFDHFLRDLTGPLLSIPDQEQMIRVFQGLTGRCLKDAEAVARWNSALCSDGEPIEFSVVIDSRAEVSVRYCVDPSAGASDAHQSVQSLRAWADLVVPYRETCSAVIDEILNRFPATMGDLREAYVAFGARYAPGKPPVGRLYFKTGDRPVERVWAFLSAHLEKDDIRLLQRPPLSHGVLLGIGYDFHPAGLGRVKAYVQVDRLSREAAPGLFQDVIGEQGAEIQRILDKISRQRHPFWVAPPAHVSMGFRLDDNSRDIKINLLVPKWEWETFRDLCPVVSLVLSEWNIPMRSEISTQSSDGPYWKFTPTWLSIGGSEKTQSLSIYFKPVREDNPSTAAAACPRESPMPENSLREGESRHAARVFEMMFDELVRADARPGLCGGTR